MKRIYKYEHNKATTEPQLSLLENENVSSEYHWKYDHKDRGFIKRYNKHYFHVQLILLNEFVNKPFNDCFSKYCKIVKPEYQRDIFQQITYDQSYHKDIRDYIVDNEGIIKKVEKERVKRQWKIDKGYLPVTVIKEINTYSPNGYIINTRTEICKEHDYVYECFDNYQDYIKGLQKFEKSQRTKVNKVAKKYPYNIDKFDISLRNGISCKEQARLRREDKKREEELNTQKIIKHGFDPLTSFRTNIN